MPVYERLLHKQEKLAVIGLGYVGLPIAIAFAKKIRVVGFDTNHHRVALLNRQIDPAGELSDADFKDADIVFTSSPQDLKDASFYIITVPTPVDENNIPFLGHLLDASALIGNVIAAGNYVVYESTVYPGCTEEDCLPVVENASGLKAGTGFNYGYSPERINLGDKMHTLEKVVKVVSGNSAESLDEISRVYELIIEAGVYRAASVKVAEAAKVIENTQRDLNIALMNELSIIFDKMNINTHEVLEAAGTKWNFLPFHPGLVGGHCIGVDPYYLTHKASQLGYDSKVILAGRSVNDQMGVYVAKKVWQHVLQTSGTVNEARVLVMGATFKENIRDIRNSKASVMINELKSYHIKVDVVDPNANAEAIFEEYHFHLSETITGKYDAVVVTVVHNEYKLLDEPYFTSILKPGGLLADLKGFYRRNIKELNYWTL